MAQEKPVDTLPDIDGETVGRFYDHLRANPLSAAALAHGEAYIGQECLLTPEEILTFAKAAGVTSGTAVLDLCSGTGGPACHLAQQLGCHVVGIDISAVGHAQARARAQAQGVTHLVQFQHGDVQTVEFPAAHFDVILGFDSWCHVPQRAHMLQRCATWLRPGGRLAFYDHVERQPFPPEQCQAFYTLWHFPGLETPESYIALVKAAGLHITYEVETSAHAIRYYTALLDIYVARRAEFEAARGVERYQEGLARLQMTQRFASQRLLGQIGCIAEKPVEETRHARNRPH